MKVCELCGSNESLTRHHLIPKTKHKNKKVKKDFGERDFEDVIILCGPCHTNLHAQFTEKTLANELNTLEAIKNSDFSSYINWRKKHLGFSTKSTKASNFKK